MNHAPAPATSRTASRSRPPQQCSSDLHANRSLISTRRDTGIDS
jgi:hypothetical protein